MTAVRDVVRDVVAKVAPDELPLVDGLAVYDDDTVVRKLNRTGPRREPLGFGWGEVVGLLTPVVWLVLDEISQRMAGAAVDGATRGAKGLLGRLTRRRREPASIPRLSTEQLADFRREVLALLIRDGLDAETAEKVADRMVHNLGTDDPGAGPVANAESPPSG